jgi:GT2 family glycosyltransferase
MFKALIFICLYFNNFDLSSIKSVQLQTEACKKMDLSIIIVNYKAWSSLSITLSCLKDMLNEKIDFEVIVVDNCSNDGHLAKFVQLFGGFKFIQNSGNWGFSDACNLGAASASRNYFLFLNPDTLPNAPAIEAIYSVLKNQNEYGILGCLQNDRNELNIKLAPNLFTLLGFTRMIYRFIHQKSFEKRSCRCQSIAQPDWVSGSIVMISRKWFEHVGGWDADFWLYSEDTDLSRRVAMKGGMIGILCTHKMIHRHGGASRVDNNTTAITKTEVKISNHVYLQKHFTGGTKIAGHLLLMVNNLLINLPVAIAGTTFFFIVPLNVYSLVYRNLILYYLRVIQTGIWMSPRSKNYPATKYSTPNTE